MSTKPTFSRSIIVALLAASALALGGCAEATGRAYVPYVPVSGAHLSNATLVTTTTPTPVANSPSSKPPSHAAVKLSSRTAAIR